MDLKDYLNGSEWHITELGWDHSRQGIEESIFNLGNGYIGSRGVLEELPRGAQPGTFFAGIYDSTCAQVKELINAPNPISLQVAIGGEKLDVSAMDVLDHERILDISQGILYRRTIFQTTFTKTKILYQSIRFFSMANPHVASMRVVLTPLNHPAKFTIKTAIDTSVTNSGLVTEGPKRHFFLHEYALSGHANYLCTKTLENEILLAYATQLEVKVNRKAKPEKKRVLEFKVKKGENLTLTKYFSLLTSKNVPVSRIKAQTLATLKRSVSAGFEHLIHRHSKAWKNLWDRSDIKIEGDPELLRAIRYNIYNLLMSGSPHVTDDVSIGAKCLTGEGYRGHVFWDAEIFILPFLAFTFPDVAKKLLIYRYKRLNAARTNAKNRGYSGAMFPWESTDTGEDVTPTWHKDFDGRIIKINTMNQEHHITADVAFAVWQYYQVSNDEEFILSHGLEILLEAARFWFSRVKYDKKQRHYVINGVIGPDEFHENVNNNAFTNWMAKWTLQTAKEAVNSFMKKHPKKVKVLMKRLNVTKPEIQKWIKAANLMYLPYKKRGKLLEQFDGFLKKRKYPLPDIDVAGLPNFPKQVSLEKIANTQFVKQADVVLLLFLFSKQFSKEFTHRNYSYYETRTLHKSSLSVPIHAAVAARLGLLSKAYRYLKISAHTDLENIYGNTAEGIHAAALGGTWQAIIKGFCGMNIEKGVLSFSPILPAHWKTLSFSLHCRGGKIDLNITTKEIKIRWNRPDKKEVLSIYIYDQLTHLKPGRWYKFPRKDHPPAAVDMKGLF